MGHNNISKQAYQHTQGIKKKVFTLLMTIYARILEYLYFWSMICMSQSEIKVLSHTRNKLVGKQTLQKLHPSNLIPKGMD